VLENEPAALADEKRMQALHLAILLRLSQTLRDFFRYRSRKGARRGQQPCSENGQQMAAIEFAHGFLAGGTMHGCRSASLTNPRRIAASNSAARPAASSIWSSIKRRTSSMSRRRAAASRRR
jgi:hypothetical protein